MSAYDVIAEIYDADMGASMTLDDAGYYCRLARAEQGPVLELGCGTGRLLSALMAEGVPVVGVDLSLAMLQQARLRCCGQTKLLQMDLCQLGLRGDFALVLLPYSLVTHLRDEADWEALARGLRDTIRPGAKVVVDAFIPRPQLPGSGWLRDYARCVGGRWLVRHKRVTRVSGGTHRIERRYRMKESFGGRTLRTVECIRPYRPEELLELSGRYLGKVLRIDFDYEPGIDPDNARFCTVVLQWDDCAWTGSRKTSDR
jgi:SAM-dependent methyltransferase